MTRVLMTFLIIVAAAFAVAAQEKYRVGDKVELECNCFGPTQWVPATIEQVQSNNTYRVRYGSGTYNYLEQVGTDRIRRPGAGAAAAKQNEMRRNFLDETTQYRESVFSLMMVYDENLVAGQNKYGPPVNASGWSKTMSDLAALDSLCRSKYSGMTNDPRAAERGDLFQMPATWCDIAAKREELQSNGRGLALSQQLGPTKQMYLKKLGELLDESAPYLSYDYQALLFDRAAWKASFMKTASNAQAGTGATVPESYFTEIYKKADELRVREERSAPSRKFQMPPYRDAAIEQQIRSAYASQLKGTTIVKIGLDYTTWKIWKNTLGIPTSQTKRGRVLAKVSGRPLCQEQEFVVVMEYAGGGRYRAAKIQNGVGGAGLLMACE